MDAEKADALEGAEDPSNLMYNMFLSNKHDKSIVFHL